MKEGFPIFRRVNGRYFAVAVAFPNGSFVYLAKPVEVLK